MTLLEEARTQINQIDADLAKLFEARMACVTKVAAYKQDHGLPVFDQEREKQVVAKNLDLIANPDFKPYYAQFIANLMDLAKGYQQSQMQKNTIAYQGTEGAFSYIAAGKIYPTTPKQAYASFEEVFTAVLKGEAAAGVIPFENSSTGEVGEVLDLLFKYDCYIQELFDLKINQNLLVVPGAKISDIKQVYSHPQAIGQCRDFLAGQSFEVIPYANTALAAKYVADCQDTSKAAIASAETAELFKLALLAQNINSSKQNTTRFIIIGQEPKTTGNRFNLLFTVGHNPGQLAKIMAIIGEFGFNLESIKSRPLQDLPWQYYFYIEIIGNLQDQQTAELLTKLKLNCTALKVLGSYTII